MLSPSAYQQQAHSRQLHLSRPHRTASSASSHPRYLQTCNCCPSQLLQNSRSNFSAQTLRPIADFKNEGLGAALLHASGCSGEGYAVQGETSESFPATWQHVELAHQRAMEEHTSPISVSQRKTGIFSASPSASQ